MVMAAATMIVLMAVFRLVPYFDVTSPLDARGVYTFQKPCLRVQNNSLSPSIQSEKNMNAKQIVLPSILGKKWSKRVGAVMCHVTLVSVRPSVRPYL